MALQVCDIETVQPTEAGEVEGDDVGEKLRVGPVAIEVVPTLVVHDSAVPVGAVDLHVTGHGGRFSYGPTPATPAEDVPSVPPLGASAAGVKTGLPAQCPSRPSRTPYSE